jgi:hypothetical protein
MLCRNKRNNFVNTYHKEHNAPLASTNWCPYLYLLHIGNLVQYLLPRGKFWK